MSKCGFVAIDSTRVHVWSPCREFDGSCWRRSWYHRFVIVDDVFGMVVFVERTLTFTRFWNEFILVCLLNLELSWRNINTYAEHNEFVHCANSHHTFQKFDCGTLSVLYTVWKNEKFTLIEKIFRQINSLVISFVKTLISRKICQKSMRVNCHYFHSVWKNAKFTLI